MFLAQVEGAHAVELAGRSAPARRAARGPAAALAPAFGRGAFAYTRAVAHSTPQVEPVAHNANLRAAPQMREYAEIVATIRAAAPGLVLDWGCGWGQITSMLAAAGLAVESFDYGGPGAPNAEVVLEAYPEHRAYVSSEDVALPYEDGRYDAVLSCGVLEHVKDPGASLDEIRRVLAPGGTLYCYKLPNRFSYLELIARHTNRFHHGEGDYDLLYTTGSARRLFESHGYEVVELRRANMLPLLLTGAWAAAAEDLIWKANRALARVPLLNFFATNVELVARRAA
jgi:cyclopropane fatty-acyl-phospholipid synthase-like methyltransferase